MIDPTLTELSITARWWSGAYKLEVPCRCRSKGYDCGPAAWHVNDSSNDLDVALRAAAASRRNGHTIRVVDGAGVVLG